MGEKNTQCLQETLKVSKTCAMCTSGAAEYTFQNCKWKCLSYSKGCIECGSKYDDQIVKCMGGLPPSTNAEVGRKRTEAIPECFQSGAWQMSHSLLVIWGVSTIFSHVM